ncbi:MAG: DinB family protein, partial [Gemmatimonadota bacterium]
MSHRERPSPDEYSDFFARYLARVPEGDIVAILRGQLADTVALLDAVPADREGHAYAAGKWTIKEVVGHLADSERVLAYRALRIARGDATPLPGFDENAYVPAGGFEARALAGITAELEAVRRATVALFEGLPEP